MNTNKGVRVLLNVVAFLGSYLILYMIDPGSDYWVQFFKRAAYDIAEDCGSTLLFSLITTELCLYIDRRYNKKIPWTVNPLKRLLYQSTVQIAAIFVVNLIGMAIYLLVQGSEKISHADIVENIQWTFLCIIIGFMVSAINTGNYFLNNWKVAALEVARHKITEAELKLKAANNKQAAMEAELQALKLQLDTHFVFNNLSVLSELILEDQQLGYAYAENFTKVYRYLLVNSKRKTITLEEEIRFIEAYIFLVMQRIGEGVRFEIEVDRTMLKLGIPPLTVQLLVENALKHNRTLKDNPLIVRIYTTQEKLLVVENQLLPVTGKPMSTGIGLSNILNRYDLIYDKRPITIEEKNLFTVKVPLIE